LKISEGNSGVSFIEHKNPFEMLKKESREYTPILYALRLYDNFPLVWLNDQSDKDF